MASAHEFSIPVRELDAGGKHLHFPIRAAWLRGALEGTEIEPAGPDGELDLRVSKSGNDVVVHGSLAVELTAPCARCLERARVTVKEPVTVLAVPEAHHKPGPRDDDDLSPDQLDTIPYDGETVILDELVRDELVLGVPMIPLCSEACPGIRPQPSQESSQAASEPTQLDPRLRPLLRLKKTQTE
jgi:uncharacterized protein